MRLRSTSSERGAVIPVVGLTLTALMTMTAFTIDLGRVSLKRRDLQKVADAVAFDMARLLDGRATLAYATDPAWDAQRVESATRNDFAPGGAQLVVAEAGCYVATSQVFDPSCGFADAVRVTARDTVDYFFQPGDATTERTAIGQQKAEATYSLGSTMAELDTGNSALLNPIVSQLLTTTPLTPGTNGAVNLGAVSYQGLAFANVTLGELVAAAGVGTLTELLDSDVTIGGFSALAAQALTNRGDLANAALFDTFRLAATNTTVFRLGDVLAVDTPGSSSALDAEVNLFDLFLAGAQAANTNNFISLGGAIPPITAPLPGGVTNLSVTSSAKLIEAPDIGSGPVGSPSSETHTAQIRVTTIVEFDLAITVAGTGLRGRVRVPLDTLAAGADGILSAINCAAPEAIDVTVGLNGASTTINAPSSSPLVVLRTIILGLGVDMARITTNTTASPFPPSDQVVSDVVVGETDSAAGNVLDFGGILNAGNISVQLLGNATLDVAEVKAAFLAATNPTLTLVTDALRDALNLLGVSSPSADVNDIDVNCVGIGLTG